MTAKAITSAYSGACPRCHAGLTATVTVEGGQPYPLIGALCPCGERGIAVVLTVKEGS